MWLMLLLLTTSADAQEQSALRLHYGQSTTHIIYPYVRCVTKRDGKVMPPKGTRLALRACRAIRREIVTHAGKRERPFVKRALTDFDLRYAKCTLRGTDVREN
jgi:hypothetical protein